MNSLTLEEFAKQLRALLRKAEDDGLNVDEFYELAEHILATGWAED